MNDDVLVRVEKVSKRFCRSLKRSLWYGLQDLGSELGGRRHGGGIGLPRSSADVKLRKDEFWAVKDVSFELRRGECLGLIGRNGAGKTTLLRMLNGLIKPDTGLIELRGQMGALIALGAGFNPLLSGRENIYIYAGVIGLKPKEVDVLIPEIIEFAELEGFIDSPFQTYSSGMQVRLGFAVASSMSPEIMLVDEVLAVGDTSFRAKCYNRIGNMIQSGTSIILVSHNAPDIERLCSKGLYLSKDKFLIASASEALAFYRIAEDSAYAASNGNKAKSGSGEAIISRIEINGRDARRTEIVHGEPLFVSIDYKCYRSLTKLNASISLTHSNESLYSGYTLSDDGLTVEAAESGRIEIRFKSFIMAPGVYIINACLMDKENQKIYDWIPNAATVIVKSTGRRIVGHFSIPHEWKSSTAMTKI